MRPFDPRPDPRERGPYRRRPRRKRGLLVKLQERPLLLVYRTAEWLFAHLPPRAGVALLQAVYTVAYFVWPPKSRIMRANLAHVLGLPIEDGRTAAAARRAYRTYARYVAELLRMPSRSETEIAELIDEHQLESFLESFDSSHGLIVPTAHIGNGEAIVAGFSHLGLPANILADDSTQGELFDYLTAQRRRWGVRMIPWRNLREVYRILAQGEILGLTVDWGYRPGDVPVRLFGQWTTLPSGPAILAARTGALIVPVFSYRQASGRYFVFHTDPIRADGSSKAEVQRVTQRIAEALETALARAPEQWYSFQQVWPATADEQAQLAERAAHTISAGA
jgi:KDO2-lipid IV(A) lauroyltransferase